MLIIFWQISVIPNQRIPSLPLQSNPAYDKLDNNEKALEANYEEASKAADESFQWFYYTEEMCKIFQLFHNFHLTNINISKHNKWPATGE